MPQIPKGLTPVEEDNKKKKSKIPKGLTPVDRPKMEVPSFVPGMSEEVQRRRAQLPSTLAPPVPAEGSAAGEFVRGVAGEKGRGFAGGAGEAVRDTFIETPKAVYHAAKDQPTEEEKQRISKTLHRGPGLTFERLLVEPQRHEYLKAQEYAGRGEMSQARGHMAGALLPVFGPIAGHMGERVGRGEWREAIGEGATYFLLDRMTRGATKEVEPSKRMATAAGGKATEFAAVAPDLAEAAKKYGRPETVGQFQDLIIRTGKDMETQFNLKLQPIAGQTRLPHEVAQALLDKANSSHLAQTAEGRATRNLLRQKALEYQKPWTLGELNKQRMDMFNARFEAKTAPGQMAAMKSSAETMANQIIEDKLRDIVYDDMNAYYGGKIDVRGLKRKQSQILDIMDRMEKQVESLADAQAELQSAGLTEKLGLSLSGHFGGVTPRVHGLLKTLKGGPQKVADVQVRKAFPASLKETVTTGKGFKDKTSQIAHGAVRQSIRNLPLTAFIEADKKSVDKK